jgi:hypothetical protein
MKNLALIVGIAGIQNDFCRGFTQNNGKFGTQLRHPSKSISGVYLPLSYNGRQIKSQKLDDVDETSSEQRSISVTPLNKNLIEIKGDVKETEETLASAKTNTVNERLMAELEAAAQTEKGPKTSAGKKLAGTFRYSDKTDAEREIALQQARDLNGVNPTVTILASFFAFGMAFGLWSLTQYLGDLFLSHPVSADAPYAFSRIASVFRNAIMGLSSLASGFSLVTGIGVFSLGVRVAYGVITGELDPTPITRSSAGNLGKGKEDFEIPNVLDLMMNKKPNKRGRR